VTYRGGEQTIVIDKGTPIVALTKGAEDDLKPGAGVIVYTTGKDAGGAYEAAQVVVGRNGVNPPM